MDVNFAKGLEAWAVAEGLTVDTTGHVEARILRALRALATVAGQGGFVAFNNEVLTLLTTIAASAGGGDADSVGGFTPGTAGGAVIESETAADVRTAAALGSIATQAADSVSISGGSVTGITDLAVADGGTGASTAAGARDNIVFASSGVVNPASPYTVAAGVNRVTLNASGTVVLPALSSYADVQPIVVINGTSSAITVTLDPDGTETIDGGGAGASAAYTVAARGSVGAVRLSATAWGSVQSGSVGVTGARIYQSGGVLYAVGQGIGASGRVDVGTPVAMTAVAGGGKVTQSGTDITLASGAVAAATPAPDVIGGEGQCWWVALSALGVTAPSFGDRITSLIRMTTRPTVDRAYVGCALLSGEWATSAETVFTAALGYGPSNKLARWSGGVSTFSSSSANAGIDLLTVQMGVRLDKALVQYTDAAKTATTSLSTTIAPSAAAPTHMGFFVCAAGGNTASAATFGDVIAYFDFVYVS